MPCGSFSLLQNSVFHVTDEAGKKLTDETLMLHIQQVILSLSTNIIRTEK